MKNAVKLVVLINVYSQINGLDNFACVEPLHKGNDPCSTSVASCEGNETILIDQIHYGVKNTNHSCSTDATECKTFLKGCCTYSENDEFEILSPHEALPILQICDGQRNCSFSPSEIGVATLRDKDYIMIEYSCVNVSYFDMCSETPTSTSTREGKLAYIPTLDRVMDVRKTCSCDISSSYMNTSMELTLANVRLVNRNHSCTPSRLSISDKMALSCGVVSGLTMTLYEPLTVDLEISNNDPPEMIWIYLEAKVDRLKINCSSRTYTEVNKTESERGSNRSAIINEDCPKQGSDQTNLAVVIAVPSGALVIVVALVIFGIIMGKRLGNDTKSKPRKEVSSVDSPFYHTVEAHELEVELQVRNPGPGSPNTAQKQQASGLAAGHLDRSNAADNTNEQNQPTANHYERISVATIDGDQNVGYTSYSVEQPTEMCERKEIVNNNPTISNEEDNVVGDAQSGAVGARTVGVISKETDGKHSALTASYDKLTFSKQILKIPTYNKVGDSVSPTTEHI